MHIIIDKICVGPGCKPSFKKECNMVAAPDLCQNLVLLNILRTNGQNSNKYCMDIDIDKICFGVVRRHF